MNPQPETTRDSTAGLWVTLIAGIGCFLIFAIVLYLAYLPRRSAAVAIDLAKIPAEEQWKYSPAGRQAHLEEMRAREQAAQAGYGWVDRPKGVVRLPIDRAMELTLRDLNAARQH